MPVAGIIALIDGLSTLVLRLIAVYQTLPDRDEELATRLQDLRVRLLETQAAVMAWRPRVDPD